MIETLERYVFLYGALLVFFLFKPEHRSSVLGGRWYCGSARARQMIDQDNEHVKKMPRFAAMSD